jgi:hypothetical protein
MAVDGAIAERVRGILPATWDMLSGLPTFGDSSLRLTIDTVKARTFGVVVTPTAEATYPVIVVDYVAKLAALELITPGIDAWRATAPVTVSATGTNEQTSYSDAVSALDGLREDLLAEIKKLWPIVAPLIDYRPINGGPRPASSTINEDFLTPSPLEFPRPYRVTDRT